MDFFPYGVQYYRQPTPLPSEWKEDLKNIKDAGYTHIQLRPQWKWGEREEGKYFFDDIDTLMDLAYETGLRVILKPMVECAPDWIFALYGGSRVGFRGVPIPPIAHGAFYVGGWLPCFDNPVVKERSAGFAKALATRFKDHPALWFYNAWNEPRSRPTGQCQCEHSKKSFREYLKRRFHTIEELNEFYGKAYTSFEFIDPPCSVTDYVEMMLWREWAAVAVSEHVKNIYDALKSADPQKTVMCHVGGCQMVNDPLDDTTNDMLNASVVDFYGTSFPVALEPKNMRETVTPMIIGDWLRRVDKNFWIQEFYPCQEEWGKEPKDSNLRRLLWLSVATGCKGWTYWQYRSERVGNESNGWGMREISGEETERSKVCDDIGLKLREIGSLLVKTERKPTQVAQIYHTEQDLLSRLEEWTENFVDDDKRGVPYKYKKTLVNEHVMFSSCLENGMDFVTWDDDFSKYKLICCGGEEIITPEMARKLKDYVKKGGNLYVEYPFAERDVTTWVSPRRPNNGLEELLGIRETALYKEIHSATIDNVTFKDIPIYIKAKVVGDVKVFGNWDTGEPCAFEKSFGKGKVFTSLSPVCCGDEQEKGIISHIAKYIYNSIGIGPLLPTGLFKIERADEESNKSITFVFNFTDSLQPVDISGCKIVDCDKCKIGEGKAQINTGGFVVYC
ncbi:MAG: beta-galactosidase [Abditibacteriota bacterium]|nr:beta-galactosidase [Abditibacteriota bacterium]